MHGNKNIGVALIGLLVVAAISMAAASGWKPAREASTKTSVRVLTDVEASQLARRFPGLRARVQITGELLERLFPRTAFYRAVLKSRGVTPAYLTAISDSGPITMPDGFNRLFGMYNTEINDKNKVEMAKAFVLMVIGNEPNYNPETNYPTGLDSFPPVTFMDADVTEHRIGDFAYGVELKVRIGEHVEVWHFSIWGGKFGFVLRTNAKGRTINFYIPGQIKSRSGRSQLDPDPDMVIEDTLGQAYVEYYPNGQPWYYLTVDTNSTATHDTVVFSVSGFPPESTNVYIGVYGAVEKPGLERLQTAAVARSRPSRRQKQPIRRVSATTAGRSRGFPASAFARRLRLMTAAVR